MYDMYAIVFDEIKDEYPEYIPWQNALENAKPNIYYCWKLSPQYPTNDSIPQEFQNKRFQIFEETITISPDNPVNFRSKIFLLVDKSVFSSVEGFAYFVKSTGRATIVGQRTHGDGVSNDPVIGMLPESGMLFRFSGTAGFNPDGSINAEVGTMPDIEIEGRNKDERLKKLINSLNWYNSLKIY